MAYCGEGEHNGESETIVKYDTISVAFNSSSYGGLDEQTGVFTAPYDGVYEISVFLSIEQTRESREESTKVLINKNGVAIPNSNIEHSPQHIWTYGGLSINNIIGRSLLIKIKQSDEISVFFFKGNKSKNIVKFCIHKISD